MNSQKRQSFPFQAPDISLSDAICWILLDYRQRGASASMPEILEKLRAEFPGLRVQHMTQTTLHKAERDILK